MATLTVQSLAAPIYLDGTKIRLEFTGDATVGAVFTQLRHKEGGNFDMVPFLNNPGFLAELNGRAWEIDGTLRGAVPQPGGAETLGSTFTAHPGLATTFVAYDATSAYGGFKSYLFEWRGVVVTGAVDGDRLWVRQLWTLAANTDQVARVYTWVGRERGQSFSIEHVRSPLLWLRAPTEVRGGESHYVASKRCRVLVPQNSFNAVSTYSANSSLYLWAQQGLNKSQIHPGVHQLQFVAVESGNNLGASYKRTVYFQTEDTQGWAKRFWYRGLNEGPGVVDVAYLKISQSYMPPFAKAFGRQVDNGLIPESEFGNSYSPNYAVQIGALTAATDDYWYDCCALYRSWAEGAGFLPAKVPSNAALSTFKKNPHYWLGCINVDPGAEPIGTYSTFVAQFKAQLAALSNPYFTSTNNWCHLQTWKYGFATASIAAQSDADFVAQTSALIHALGAYVSVYSIARDSGFYTNYGIGFHAASQRCLRSGLAATAQGHDVDFSIPNAGTALNDAITKFMVRLQLDGVYTDGLVGTGFREAYAPGCYLHTRHGGTYSTEGMRAFLQQMRAMVRASAFAGRDTDKPIILSEQNEEFVTGLADLGQEAYHWHPWHTTMMEWVVWDGTGLLPDLTADDYPRAQRNMAPPLWDCVYHEYQPSQHFSVMPTNAGLATNTDFATIPFPGISPTELIDLHCCMRAGSFVSGMSAGFFDYNAAFVGSNMINLDATGKVVVGNAVFDPTGAGLTIWAFYKTLYQSQLYSYAGQFTLYGKMLRPLAIDYSSVDLEVQNNPASVCRTTNPNGFLGTYPYFYFDTTDIGFTLPGIPWGTRTGWDVPKVHHGMWQSQEGVIGLLLVNWSNAAASWIATFDPAKYGFGAGADVSLLEINGNVTPLGTALVASTLGTTGVVADIDIGVLPARSLTVLIFTAP